MFSCASHGSCLGIRLGLFASTATLALSASAVTLNGLPDESFKTVAVGSNT